MRATPGWCGRGRRLRIVEWLRVGLRRVPRWRRQERRRRWVGGSLLAVRRRQVPFSRRERGPRPVVPPARGAVLAAAAPPLSRRAARVRGEGGLRRLILRRSRVRRPLLRPRRWLILRL